MKLGLRERYRGYALITGAARGIGRAFAFHLAEDGFDLLLLDRETEEIQALARSLRTEHGVDARPLVRDLSEPGLIDDAQLWTESFEIGLLVNNAGVSPFDPFFEIPLRTHLETLDVNCRATLVLTHVIGKSMAVRGRGGIVIVSSASASSGSPYFCHYAATKGYGLNLAAGLWSELRGSGVDVLAVCPGMTDTAPVRGRNLHQNLPFYVPITAAEPVAHAALRALGKQPVIVPTFGDRISTGMLLKLLPRRWTLSIVKRLLEKMRG